MASCIANTVPAVAQTLVIMKVRMLMACIIPVIGLQVLFAQQIHLKVLFYLPVVARALVIMKVLYIIKDCIIPVIGLHVLFAQQIHLLYQL